jgi:hypothetical protein
MKPLICALLLPIIMPAADWLAVRDVPPGSRVTVALDNGKYEQGRLKAVFADSVVIDTNRGARTLQAPEVRRMFVRQKASRWKGAMLGALVGFGIGFAIGAPSAGYITDQNDPSGNTRLGIGSGMGLFAAGIGAPLGALGGGSKNVTVYRSERKKP